MIEAEVVITPSFATDVRYTVRATEGTKFEVCRYGLAWPADRADWVAPDGRPLFILENVDVKRVVESATLAKTLIDLAAARVPGTASADGMGLDGTTFRVTTRRYASTLTFEWWGEPPPEWQAIAQFTKELIAACNAVCDAPAAK